MSEFMVVTAPLVTGPGCELTASCDSSEDAAADPRAVVDVSSSQESSDTASCLLSQEQAMAEQAAVAGRGARGLGLALSHWQGALTQSPWNLWACRRQQLVWTGDGWVGGQGHGCECYEKGL